MRLFFNQQLKSQIGKGLNKAQRAKSKALDHIGSGKRLRKAADDPARLAMSRSMESMKRSLGQAHRNVLDGVSMAQVAESGVNKLSELTTKMRQRAIQAANGAIDDETRQALARDYSAMLAEYGRLTNTVQFNTQNLLGPDAQNTTNLQIQVGIDGDSLSRLTPTLRDVSLRQVGRTTPTSGHHLSRRRPCAR